MPLHLEAILQQFSFDFKLHLFFWNAVASLKVQNSPQVWENTFYCVCLTFKTHINMLVQPKLFKITFLKAEITHKIMRLGRELYLASIHLSQVQYGPCPCQSLGWLWHRGHKYITEGGCKTRWRKQHGGTTEAIQMLQAPSLFICCEQEEKRWWFAYGQNPKCPQPYPHQDKCMISFNFAFILFWFWE